MIFIPFFGEMGEYSGQPGIYSMTGVAASEAESAIGLYLCESRMRGILLAPIRMS